jgi:hypothetical protein
LRNRVSRVYIYACGTGGVVRAVCVTSRHQAGTNTGGAKKAKKRKSLTIRVIVAHLLVAKHGRIGRCAADLGWRGKSKG